jgi:hypothetical protein
VPPVSSPAEDRDSAGEGTGGTFSEKFSRSARTLQYPKRMIAHGYFI